MPQTNRERSVQLAGLTMAWTGEQRQLRQLTPLGSVPASAHLNDAPAFLSMENVSIQLTSNTLHMFGIFTFLECMLTAASRVTTVALSV